MPKHNEPRQQTRDCERCNRTVTISAGSHGAYGYDFLCKPCDNSLNPNFAGVRQAIRERTPDHATVLGDVYE